MFKRSTRYFVLALTLVALTATTRSAHALSDDDPCTDPTNPACVVSGTEPPPPNGKAVSQSPTGSTLANSQNPDDSQSNDDLVSYLIILYGLA